MQLKRALVRLYSAILAFAVFGQCQIAAAKENDSALGPQDLSCQALMQILTTSQPNTKASVPPKTVSAKKRAKAIGSVRLRQMRPLQGALGLSRVALNLRDWIDGARLIAFNFRTDERPFIIERIKAEASRGIDALIDPDGRVRPKDGHHKIRAIATLMKIYRIPEKSISFTVKVKDEDDFRQRTWNEFGEYVVRKGLLALSPEQEAASEALGESAADKVQRAPEDFLALENSPMRSTTGQIFEISNLAGSHFSPMAQFLFGRALREKGLVVKAGREFSGEVIGRGLALLFDESLGESETLQALLISAVDPKFAKVVKQSLAESKAKYDSVRRSIETNSQFDEVDFFDSSDFEPDGEALDVVSQEARIGEIMFNMTLQFPSVLPESISLPDDEKVYQRLFADVLALEPPAELETAIGILKSIKQGKFSKDQRAEKKIIKELRKFTLLVRSAYRFLSAENEAPDGLVEFSSQLGELNDLIAKWSQDRIKYSEVRDAAGRLVQMLKENNTVLSFSFQPVHAHNGEQSFLQYQGKLIKKMQNVFDKERRLTVDNYHWLRRRVRDFANLLKILQLEEHDISVDLLAQMLSNLSRRMGTVKDGLIHSEYADDIKNPGKQRTELDPISDRMLMQFFLIMERSLKARMG